MTKLAIFKANLIKLLDKKKHKLTSSLIFNLILTKYSRDLTLLYLLMDKPVREKLIQCLEVIGKILSIKILRIKSK
jgi:hypothetical protein